MTNTVQVWNPDDWESFSLNLLQGRHGALEVQKIPAKHKGDFGIDYYCTKDSVAYQCYPVEEPVDISNRANKQKTKITKDLGKLVKNQEDVGKLFHGAPIKHWILLVPVHDSKDVNLHCAKKMKDLRNAGCAALDATFETKIQDIGSFPIEAVNNEFLAPSTVNLSVPFPSQSELDNWAVGSSDLLTNASKKLEKRASPEQLDEFVAEAVRSFLQGNALLDALRSSSPELHEKVVAAIGSRARRLQFSGPKTGDTAGEVLDLELDALIDAMKSSAPSLSAENAEQIAYGAICEWIMRCPLDFPNVQ